MIISDSLSNIFGRTIKALTARGLKIVLFSFWCLTLISVAISYFTLNISFSDFVSVIREFIIQQGVWAPVVYISFYSFRSLIFFPASLLTILSGLLFGPWDGLLFTIIGENISANFSFLVGRYFSSDLEGLSRNKNQFISRLFQVLPQ